MKTDLIFKYLVLLTALSFTFTMQAFSQNQRNVTIFQKDKKIEALKDLEVNFSADKLQGSAPLEVQFTDLTAPSEITAWLWRFGDGDSSTIQNPIHTYQNNGKYTVKLTVTDSNNYKYTLSKENYITVGNVYTSCDSLRFPHPEPLTNFLLGDNEGYVFGTNKYLDKAVADSFYVSNVNSYIIGVIFDLSVAKQKAGNNELLPICVWNSDGNNGSPRTLLGTDTVELSRLVNDVENQKLTSINFKNPIKVNGSFYIGLTLPKLSQDSLAFWSTQQNTYSYSTSWIQLSDNTWSSAKKLYSQPDNAFIVSNAIYPKICTLLDNEVQNQNETKLFPNPASKKINIQTKINGNIPIQFAIKDISGKVILTGFIKNEISQIDISKLNKGIYFFSLNNIKPLKFVVID